MGRNGVVAVWKIAGLIGVVACLLLAAPGGAGAADQLGGSAGSVRMAPTPGATLPGWQYALLQRDGSHLFSVSCITSTCVAVGYYSVPSQGVRPLVEKWSGTRWTPTLLPAVSGFYAASLHGVACVTSTSCVAVGDAAQYNGADAAPIAARLSGGRWHVHVLPRPAGRHDASAEAVSCVSATSCTAVGLSDDVGMPQLPIATQLQNGRWTTATIPKLASATSQALSAVSCTASTACVATGYADLADGNEIPVTEILAGASWKTYALPIPAKDLGAEIAAISCPAAKTCVAVGFDVDALTHTYPFVETLAGGTWKPRRLPAFTNQIDSRLTAVSCITVRSCTAAGYSNNSNGIGGAVHADVKSGRKWTRARLPSPTNSRPYLEAISCSTATRCIAAGEIDNINGNQQAFVERH